MKRLPAVIALLLAAAGAGALAWAAYAPIKAASHDALFEIPKGTWERRMAGQKAEILPDTITLVLGVNDVLLLRNSDNVPQVFGPVLIMPGQDFHLPFEQAGEHPFACTAHASGQMTVVVKPTPLPGWQRLQWRLQSLLSKAPWRD
ncbi:hypothetical protein [Duganella sp. Root1480D1]|uniref:cupredoxin domain-containing protein n=1 Tax=Duganella sp. Root1480D1 TaxID=1736471 RepID=UPI000709DA76|nr:hypothetical protein [Duganella sp. Root1480D1]KQZ44073.1 hypothetical protein ASD58_20270 [Duganella sp. Root1480D1]